MSAPTAPPERKCRRCGARDRLTMIINLLGDAHREWQCLDDCPAIRHPDQPDRIDEDSSDLPDAARAARRVRAWICEWGDGLINVTNRRPLYARDLEALVRAAAEARAELDQWRATYGESALPGALNLMKQRTRRLTEARAELERLRELERVARKWRATQPPQLADTGVHREVIALADAVDALDADTPPCPGGLDCRKGHRCPEHRDADGVVDRVLLDATGAEARLSAIRSWIGTYPAVPEGHDGPLDGEMLFVQRLRDFLGPDGPGGRLLATWSMTGPVDRVAEQARIALAQMASEYADAGPMKLRAEVRTDCGEPR